MLSYKDSYGPEWIDELIGYCSNPFGDSIFGDGGNKVLKKDYERQQREKKQKDKSKKTEIKYFRGVDRLSLVLTTINDFKGEILDPDNPEHIDITSKFIERLVSSIKSDNKNLTISGINNLRENIRKVMRGQTLEDIFGRYI